MTEKGYVAVYKCRLCGELHNADFSYTKDKTTALLTMGCACAGTYFSGSIGLQLCATHLCKNGDFGITDFQGYKKIEEETP